MTPELLAGLAGVGLSVIAKYVPGASTWYEVLPPDRKRFAMVVSVVAAGIGATLWACWGGEISCASRDTWEATLDLILRAGAANQATHWLTPERKRPEEA